LPFLLPLYLLAPAVSPYELRTVARVVTFGGGAGFGAGARRGGAVGIARVSTAIRRIDSAVRE